MRKIIMTLLFALFIAAASVGPAYAKGSADDGVIHLTKAETQRKLETSVIRNRLTTEPPAPQPYWKVYVSDDFKLVIVCKHDDETGRELYCDIYVF